MVYYLINYLSRKFDQFFYFYFDLRTIVAIYIKRFVSVISPKKIRRFCSYKIILKLITVSFIISVVLNSHFIWTSEIVNSVCYSFAPEIPYRFALILFTVVTNCFLPNLVLVVINIQLVKVGKREQRISLRNERPSKILTKKFIINSLVFVLIFLPLRVLNCYVVVYPEANYFGNIFYIRKIFSFLVCSYYSFFFLIHVFIMKHLRKIFNKRVIFRSKFCDNETPSEKRRFLYY
jgi:hypothetical protein